MKVEQVAVQKVEVGDIWESETELFYVYDVDDESISIIGKIKEVSYLSCFETLFQKPDERFYEFTKTYKYVGKAKGNIKDLFEARDESKS